MVKLPLIVKLKKSSSWKLLHYFYKSVEEYKLMGMAAMAKLGMTYQI